MGLLLLLAACGEPAEPPLKRPPLDLPVVGTVGDPPPAGERLTIQVTRSGHIRVPDRPEAVSLEGLRALLRERARAPGALAPDGSSLRTAYLEIDAGTPWAGVQWIMQTCAGYDVRIYKLSFAALTPEGKRGAIGVNLPRDGGGPTPLDFPPYHRIKVFQRDDGPASGERALADALAALPKDTTGIGAVFDIVTPPPNGGRVAYGTILRIVDASLAAGARFVSFEGAAMPQGDGVTKDPEAFAAHLAGLRAQGGVARFKIDDAKPFLPPDPPHAVPLAGRGRLAGRHGTSPDAFPMLEEIILEEEPEEAKEGDR